VSCDGAEPRGLISADGCERLVQDLAELFGFSMGEQPILADGQPFQLGKAVEQFEEHGSGTGLVLKAGTAHLDEGEDVGIDGAGGWKVVLQELKPLGAVEEEWVMLLEGWETPLDVVVIDEEDVRRAGFTALGMDMVENIRNVVAPMPPGKSHRVAMRLAQDLPSEHALAVDFL
jgi:hypothetical protein